MQRKIVKEFPAYKVFEGKSYYADGDTIAIEFPTRNHGPMYHMFYFGSVVGYAIKNGECPFEAFERSERNSIKDPFAGHKLHWLSPCSVCISSSPQAQEIHFHQEFGDIIQFHGKKFKLVPDHNQNVKLEMQ